MLAALKDEDGRMQVPGFYDDVVPLTDARARRVSRSCRSRSRVHAAARRRPACSAKRASSRSNAAGPGRRSTSTASRAATRAKARRPCCRPRPARSSASAWCRTRTRKRSRGRCSKFLEERLPPGIQMELIDHHGRPAWSCRSTARICTPRPRRSKPASAGARVHPRRRLDSDRQHLRPRARRRRAAAGLGPERRQHAQPERKVLARRFPPRHSPVRTCGRNWRSRTD